MELLLKFITDTLHVVPASFNDKYSSLEFRTHMTFEAGKAIVSVINYMSCGEAKASLRIQYMCNVYLLYTSILLIYKIKLLLIS